MSALLSKFIQFVSLSALFLLVGCDMRTELKDMHKSTQNMEKNTEKMVEITERMEKMTGKMGEGVDAMGVKTDEVNGNVTQFNGKIDKLHGVADSLEKRVGTGIEETYDGLRQGDSSQLRRVAFQGLLNARDHSKKLLEAAQYLAGFEFYLWAGFGMDGSIKRRDDLVVGAIQQFFKDIYEIYNYSPSIFAFADPDLSEAFNREASFNAMAAALHTDNPKQKENIRMLAAKGVHIEEITILKLIKQGLSAKADVESKKTKFEDLPLQFKEVLIHEAVAIKLLQARWNFIAVAAMDKSFQIKKAGAFKYFRSIWKLINTWELDFAKLNSSQIDDMHTFIEEAHSTREFLNSIGVETKPDAVMAVLIKRMRPVNVGQLSSDNQEKAEGIIKMLESFKE